MHTQCRLEHGRDASHGIDLAPMLDFVINLLIFFIITAVFLKESAITVRRPSGTDASTASPVPSITVRSSGDIVIDGKTVDVRAVRANVERLRAIDERRGLMVVAESHAPMGALIAVVDQVHLGGVYDITFTTTE